MIVRENFENDKRINTFCRTTILPILVFMVYVKLICELITSYSTAKIPEGLSVRYGSFS